MSFKIRVLLSPLPVPNAIAQPGLPPARGVSGFRLGLTAHGQPRGAAKFVTPTPAKLRFVASFLASARKAPESERATVGTLSGSIRLRTNGGGPEFVLAADALSVEGAPAETSQVGSTQRKLRIEFDGGQFLHAAGGASAAMLLPFPEPPGEHVRHLELGVELEIDGAVEAPLETNDILDVPMVPRRAFRLRLVDEVGRPLANVPLEVDLDGTLERLSTDGEGRALIDELGAAAAVARLANPESVRAELKQRWNQPRTGGWLDEGGDVLILRSSDLESGWMLTQPMQVVSIQPRVVQARLSGILFETNKNFLLPSAIPSLRHIREHYEANPGSKLLIVGHTDTSGETSRNDALSLERAESMCAFLKDDVEAWAKRFESSVPEGQRWGLEEEAMMLATVSLSAGAGGGVGVLDAMAVALFQKTHNAIPEGRRSRTWQALPEDGQFQSETRRQLIADYMNQDETSLPEDIEIITHGCGEYFPLDGSGELDSHAQSGEHDPADRRVELFFFAETFGIQPLPPGKNSKQGSREYPEWRRRARETFEYDARAGGPLDITTYAPADTPFELRVSRANGEPVARLTRDHARADGEHLRFALFPEALPHEVMFELWRNDRLEHHTGPLDPVALRDALFLSDRDGAEAQLLRSDAGDPIATPVSLAPRAAASPNKAAAPDPSKQALRVVVRWANPDHRFLRTLEISLTPSDGAAAGKKLPKLPGSTPGRASYDVPNDATAVKLVLDVKSSLVPLVHLEQNLKVLRASGFRPTIMPDGSNVGGIQHPRIQSLAFASGAPGTVVIDVPIDLLFLDVTEHVKRLPTKSVLDDGEELGRFASAEQHCIRGGVTSRIRVLEFTGGRPSAWPVILPTTLAPRVDQGVFLFLKNEALEHVDGQGVVVPKAYTNADDADYVRALYGYWSSPPVPAKYLIMKPNTGEVLYDPYPPFGWDRQVRDSGKSVVVLFPIPHSTDFGILETPSPATRRVLQSALDCLFVEGHIQTGTSFPPFINQLAVGAWSSGTDTLFKWIPASTPKATGFVDEFWIFDGKKGFPVDVRAWIKADPSRKLRLIGTAYTEVAANGLRALAGNPNVSVFPGDPKYWYRNPDYANSLAEPGVVPYRFRADPSSPLLPRDASTKSNIFIKTETLVDRGDSVDQSITLWSPGLGERRIAHLSHEEAAAFIVFEALMRFTAGAPVLTKAEFEGVTQWADAQVGEGEPKHSFRHRHPWSTMGGLFNHKGRAFVGYLQLCLENSGF